MVIAISLTINTLEAKEMIHTRDHKTAYLLDPWHFLGEMPIPVKVSICSGGKRPPVPRITVQAFRRKPSGIIGA